MPSVNDWAAKAANQIKHEWLSFLHQDPHAQQFVKYTHENMTESRLAAIIASHAEPLIKALQESRRRHYHCDDSWYCCGQCDALDHGLKEGEVVGAHAQRSEKCNCGADVWNARVDHMLEGSG